MTLTAQQRYDFNAQYAYKGPDGRFYRRMGTKIEYLDKRTGDWRMLRTASQPFRNSIAQHC